MIREALVITTLGLAIFGCTAEPPKSPEVYWEPKLDAILGSQWSIDEVCGAIRKDVDVRGETIGYTPIFLIHFTEDTTKDEWKNVWWMMTDYKFVSLSNGTFLLLTKDASGEFITKPTNPSTLHCKRKS